MRHTAYRDLVDGLIEDGRRLLADYRETDEPRRWYAFSIMAQPLAGRVQFLGGVWQPGLGLNERGEREDGACLLDGSLFRCSSMQELGPFPSDNVLGIVQELGKVFSSGRSVRTLQRHSDLLIDSLVKVVLALEPSFQMLDTTEDVVGFVCRPGASEWERMELMRRTIPDSRFRRLFVEPFRFDAEMDAWSQFPGEQESRHWAEVLMAVAGLGDEQLRMRAERAGIHEREVLRRLREIGSTAVPAMLDLLDELTGRADGDLSMEQLAGLFAQLAGTISAIRLVDDDGVEHLEALDEKLRSDERWRASGVPRQLSALLHRLRPLRFPQP